MGCRPRIAAFTADARAFVALLVVLLWAAEAVAQPVEIAQRRRPGRPAPPAESAPAAPSAQPPADADPPAAEVEAEGEAPEAAPIRLGGRERLIAVPDRWRIVENLGVNERWLDPYNQNTLKADRPAFGEDWFINVGAIWDNVVEARCLPVGRGQQATADAGDLDVFGDGEQVLVGQNVIVEAAVIKGNTTFKPPDYEFRAVVVGNVNYAEVGERGIVSVNPDGEKTRQDEHFAVQELFADKHLRNVSDYYDFDSLRVGIQPFISDFRGFLFEDSQLGVRLFGTRWRNRMQYNLAYFRRLEKDTNSGLNRVFDLRSDDIFFANAYFQDWPATGLTYEAIGIYNRNREGSDGAHFNDNGFIERPASIGDERPHNYDVGYLGLGLDGHYRRLNVTAMGYTAVGRDHHNPIAQRATDILAYFAALEGSIDIDWYRLKLYALHSSGDGNPFDGKAGGFDAIFENPNFAGADTSFWVRQNVPLVAGGDVFISGRNALIPALRSSKEEGQSSFVNPGLWLFGAGGDFDVLPQLRLTTNISSISFDDTAVLRTTRQQRAVDPHFGYDLSGALLWRPLFIENVVLRLSGAMLIPGDGFDDLYDSRYDHLYSVLFNTTLTY